MTSRRSVLATAGLVVLGAFGAWGALGTLTLSSSDSDVARVGLLPAWSLLPIVGAAVVAFGMASWRVGTGLWPLVPAALAAVPWFPMPLPAAFLAWAGPWTAVLWVCAVAAFVAGRVATPGVATRPAVWTAWLDGCRGAMLAGVLALAVYVAAGARVSPVLPGGDEPHYLIITQSLLLDGDLRIENNHQRGDYRAYAGGTLKPDYLRRGTDREIYSIHLPGASALVLPAFALGGYPLVKLWLSCLAAFASALAWQAARSIGGNAAAAWFAWAATALTAPFLFLAFTVYPDGPGSFVVVATFVALVALGRRADRSPWWWVLASLGPALLPWLHPRFAIVSACFGAVFLARAWRAPRRIGAAAAFAGVPTVSALAWFGYYLSIYGSPNPSVAYGHYTQMAVANAWRGLVGLVFDQQFGLAATAPVYVLVAVGLWQLWQRQRRLAVEWVLVVVPYTFVSAMYHMWWGGHSSPARFLGCVMLVCAVPLAAAWQVATSGATRAAHLVLLGASLVLAATLAWVDAGRLVFNTRDGMALWAVWASRSVDIARALPSVFRTDAASAALTTLAWTGFPVCVWVAARAAESRRVLSRSTSAGAMAVGFVLACAAAMTAGWRVEGASGLAPTGGQMAALTRLASDPDAPRLSIAGFGLQTGDAVSPATWRLDGGALAGRPSWAALWMTGLPAGTYRMSLDNRVPGATFDAEVLVGRSDTPIATWHLRDVPRGPVTRDITLPWPVRSLALRVPDSARRAVGRATLAVVSLPRRRAEQDMPLTSARRYGDVIVSAVGHTAYLEAPGIWTTGGAKARFVLEVPDGRSAQDLLIRAGAVATRVDVTLAGWRATLTLQPGESRPLQVPLPGGPSVLTVTASTGFRPSETDPGSTDSRLLGAWIEIR